MSTDITDIKSRKKITWYFKWMRSNILQLTNSRKKHRYILNYVSWIHFLISDEADDQDENDPMSPRPTGLVSPHGPNVAHTPMGGNRPAPGPIRGSSSNIHLWQFVKELLNNPQHSGCIHWVDRDQGIFKIVDSVRVAELWGKRKNRPAMNFDKLSRSLRQYYKKGIMKKTSRPQRLVYQFCTPYHL